MMTTQSPGASSRPVPPRAAHGLEEPAPVPTNASHGMLLPGRLGRLGRESAYLLLSWPALLTAFVVQVTLLSVGFGLIFVVVGIPLMYVGLRLAGLVTTGERLAQRHLLGREVPAGSYRREPEGTSALRAALLRFACPQTWIDVAFSLLAWVVATVTWSLAVAWWSVAVGGLLSPVFQSVWPGSVQGVGQWLVGSQGRAHLAVDAVVGLLAALSLPWAMHVLASFQSWLFGTVLGARGMQRRVTHLEASRSAARDAEATALRKLERDLHDGPQQRLVRLQMDLGRALNRLDDDPATARGAVESSLTQARQTLDELRNLSRGIAPPVLVDRGLGAALEELAGRSAIPVHLSTNLPRDRRADQISPRVQDATYFLVSECLTNAAKHSGAATADVDVHLAEGLLRIVVRDEGRGGASVGSGSGLTGLRDRVAGLDGAIDVYSPVGGPTVITAVLPCA